MKKLISLVLVLILVCTVAVTANAAKIDVSASTNIVAPGETVVVTIALEEDISDSEGTTVLQGVVNYDCNALELQNVEKISEDLTDAAKHESEDKVIFHYLSTDSTAKAFAKGELVKLTFCAVQEMDSTHIISSIQLAIAAQNAQGEDVADVVYPEQVKLVVASEHTWDEGIVTDEPTCILEGVKTYTCTFDGCGATRTEPVAATGEHQWKDATCAAPKTCESCGKTEGKALKHNWKAATAIAPKTCAACGATEGEALGLSKPVVKVSNDAVSGTPVLTWADVAHADAYHIYRSAKKNGTYDLINTAAEATYADTAAETCKTYYYKVVAVYTENEELNSAYSAVATAYAKLAQTAVEAKTDEVSGKPEITWEAVEGATKYIVQRATAENGKYSTVKTVTGTSCTDTGAAVGKTYYYRVIAAVSSSAYNSAPSNSASALTVCAQPKVTVKLDAATGKPTLSWAKVSGAAKYEIYCDGELVKTQTGTSYKDASAPVDEVRTFKVVAVAKNADHNNETELTVCAAPAQPKITAAAADAETCKPVISWNAVEGAVEYKIFRAVKSGGTYEEVGTTAELSFMDETAVGGKTYYYKVTAVATQCESAASANKSCKSILERPVLVGVETDDVSGKPEITWEAVEGATKYIVQRATAENGKYSTVKTVTGTSCTDTGAAVGKTYYYRVIAAVSSSAYNSAPSNSASALTVCAQPKVTVKLDAATGKPTLSWAKVSGAAKYEIYCDGELVKTQTGTSYKDASAPVDEVRTFKVVAVAKNADHNNETELTVCAAPAQPKIKGSVDAATGKPKITWNAVDGASGYEILRSTKKSGTYEVIGNAEEGEFIDTTALKGKTYYYKVVAVGESSRSANSAVVSVKSK